VTTGQVPKVAEQVARVLEKFKTPPLAASVPPVSASSAQGHYKEAMDAIELGEYPRAVASLKVFLQKYPNHELADNAQYWIGESHYVQKQYSSALSAFRGVVDSFPLGNKVPDAILKSGYCLLQLGDTEGARRALSRVTTEFPNTSPAALAARKLQELK
jgi:tol-pal system protein YbgF